MDYIFACVCLMILIVMIIVGILSFENGKQSIIKQQEQYQLCLESGASVEYCEKI